MSLADMINMARNVQSYQQAQQINPLLLQQQQAETRRAGAEANVSEQTQEPRISKSQAESKKSTIEAQKAGVDLNQYYGNLSRGVYGGFVFDPDFINGNSEAMVKKLTAAHDYLTKDIGIPESGSKSTDQLINLAKTNPEQAYQMIKNGIMQSGQNQPQVAAVSPQLTTNAEGNLVQVTPAGGGISMVGGKTPNVNQSVNSNLHNLNPSTAEATLKTGVSTSGVQNFDTYQKDLTARVQASINNLLRTTEARDLLSKFKPGAGSQTYANLAQKLQAIGASQDLVDKVAGGDLSAVQSFNKFLAQSVIAGVRQAAGGDQARVAEVENFLKNNPTVSTDPRALNRLFDFTDKLAQKDFAEQDFLTQKLKNGTVNPASHFGEVQQFLRQQGYIPKISEQKTNASTQNSHGKPVAQATKNGVTYIKYEDGTILPK